MMKMEAADCLSSWLVNLSSSPQDRRRAMEELIKGREMAIKLRNLIKKSTKNEVFITMSQDLAGNILSSFTNSLSMLINGGGSSSSGELSQVLEAAQTQLSSPPPSNWEAYLKSEEDSGESSKSSAVKDQRRSYKRRKCSWESWTELSSDLVADGHAWRKYGQKVILNAKFPRNYFRCTYKYDQGCQASKQVQRIEAEPPVYRTTYSGHHTCKNLLTKGSHYHHHHHDHHHHQLLLLDCTTGTDDQCPMINFDISAQNIRENSKFIPFFTSFPSTKQESKDHHCRNHEGPIPSDMTDHHHNQSSSSSDDYVVSAELITPFDDQSNNVHITVLSSDHHEGDAIYGVNSSSQWTTSADQSHSHSHSNSSSCLDIGGDLSAVNFEDILDFEAFNF